MSYIQIQTSLWLVPAEPCHPVRTKGNTTAKDSTQGGSTTRPGQRMALPAALLVQLPAMCGTEKYVTLGGSIGGCEQTAPLKWLVVIADHVHLTPAHDACTNSERQIRHSHMPQRDEQTSASNITHAKQLHVQGCMRGSKHQLAAPDTHENSLHIDE